MISTFHLRRLLFIFVCFALFYAIVQLARIQRESEEFSDLDRTARVKQISLILNPTRREVSKKLGTGEQACRHPYLELHNKDIMQLIYDVGPIQCSDVQDWVEVDGSTMRITDQARKQFGNIECNFTDVLRTADENTTDGLTTNTRTVYNLKESDFVKVNCKSQKGHTWQNVMAGIRHDQHVIDRTGWGKVPNDSLRLNVLMWGFDSLSRNMFIRRLPRSHRYLRETLKSIELQGYNIVGDGTPQALIPILTGQTELELPDTRRRMGDKASFVNVYPFVWKEFQENGYVTAFLEDRPDVGTFTYRLKGFDSPPTDHYMTPFYVEASRVYQDHKKYCLGSIPRHKVMMNYVHDFFKVYREKPKFLFAMHVELSHESYNNIGAADQDTLEWLQKINKEGHLNDTLLIMMSDHGHRASAIRNTLQGKQEERLPMFSFVFPPWFVRWFPEALANFKYNVQRLTSPFDIHPTLQNVLHYQGIGKGDINSRSISLFQEIPLERTCADADIEPHWCACLDWEDISLTDSVVQQAALAAVESINNYTEVSRELCHVLQLNKVTWAAKLAPTEELLQFRKSSDRDGFVADLSARTDVSQQMYQLKFSTTPGDGLFEVSLTYHFKNKDFTVRMSDMSRINFYGSDSHCIVHTQVQLEKYCYCKEPPPTKH